LQFLGGDVGALVPVLDGHDGRRFFDFFGHGKSVGAGVQRGVDVAAMIAPCSVKVVGR